MDYIISIVKQIFYISVISTLLTGIMPNEKYQKMIKTICGIILILVMMQPLMKLTNTDRIFENIYNSLMNQQKLNDISLNAMLKEGESTDEFIKSCEDEIAGNIDGFVLEEGMYPSETIVTICSDEEDESYGNIKSIYLVITEKNKSSSAKKEGDVNINPIQVTIEDIGNQNVSNEKISGMINKIAEYYNLEPNQIQIKFLK